VCSSLIFSLILIGATIFQTTISPYLEISGVHPDLVLVLVIGWVILRGWQEGVMWALLGGLSLDLMSAAPFGLFTLCLTLVAFITSLVHGLTFGSSIVLPLSLTFPLSLLFNGVALLLLAFGGRPVIWGEALATVLMPAAIFNTVSMLLVFPLLYLLNRWLNPQTLSF